MSTTKISAGLLMYRKNNKKLEIFLVHMGGPFHKNKDVWYLPAGMQDDDEDLLVTAKREFCEETGLVIPGLTRNLYDLGFVKYNNKTLYAWAFESDLPKNYVFSCNPTPFGWPENDKGEFFAIDVALSKIHPAQKPFLFNLRTILKL